MNTHIQNIFKAMELASFRHKKQYRKGKTKPPYINHPIQVANILINEGGEDDPTLLIGAILHDVVEDTVKNQQESNELKASIASMFGDEVLMLVEEVTDDKYLRKQERKRLQVVRAPLLSDRAKKLKLADKISNVREIITDPPRYWSRKELLAYIEWAEEVAVGLKGVNKKLEALLQQSIKEGRSKYQQ